MTRHTVSFQNPGCEAITGVTYDAGQTAAARCIYVCLLSTGLEAHLNTLESLCHLFADPSDTHGLAYSCKVCGVASILRAYTCVTQRLMM